MVVQKLSQLVKICHSYCEKFTATFFHGPRCRVPSLKSCKSGALVLWRWVCCGRTDGRIDATPRFKVNWLSQLWESWDKDYTVFCHQKTLLYLSIMPLRMQKLACKDSNVNLTKYTTECTKATYFEVKRWIKISGEGAVRPHPQWGGVLPPPHTSPPSAPQRLDCWRLRRLYPPFRKSWIRLWWQNVATVDRAVVLNSSGGVMTFLPMTSVWHFSNTNMLTNLPSTSTFLPV